MTRLCASIGRDAPNGRSSKSVWIRGDNTELKDREPLPFLQGLFVVNRVCACVLAYYTGNIALSISVCSTEIACFMKGIGTELAKYSLT